MSHSKLPTAIASRAISSFTDFCQAISHDSTNETTQRPFLFEALEERCVLSANGLDIGPAAEAGDSILVATEEIQNQSPAGTLEAVQTDITSVTVRVNGEEFEIPQDSVLELNVGDEFEVVGISFDSNATSGVFAAEGYINKIGDTSSASLIDYNDGRFSLIEDNFDATGFEGSVAGLAGSWTAETGWDRLTISLIHYTQSETVVSSRSLIQLEVGQADFAFDEKALSELEKAEVRAGEKFDIFGAWTNNGNGNFHNYAEVDIYHESNTEEIVWAGALVGNASADGRVEGYFVNTRSDDTFSEVFVPEQPGSYFFRFYLDPEAVVAESDESNNRFDVKVTVSPANTVPVANNDKVATDVNSTLEKIDVLANDLDDDGDNLQVAKFTQPENGEVRLNKDGTFSYRPDNNFQGGDEFKYSVTDGETDSDFATVAVEVTRGGFAAAPVVSGDEDTAIKLHIEADTEQFTHVRISNVPDGAELSHGDRTSAGNFDVRVKDLGKLTITPAPNSDAEINLVVTPFNDSVAYANLTAIVKVEVNAVADRGFADVANFAIISGSGGKLPFEFGFADLDGSERHTVTFKGLPEFISLSAGEKIDNSWVLDYDDLENLHIQSAKISDLSGFSSNRFAFYKRFEVSVSVRSVESSNGSLFEAADGFSFLAISRR